MISAINEHFDCGEFHYSIASSWCYTVCVSVFDTIPPINVLVVDFIFSLYRSLCCVDIVKRLIIILQTLAFVDVLQVFLIFAPFFLFLILSGCLKASSLILIYCYLEEELFKFSIVLFFSHFFLQIPSADFSGILNT